MLLLGACSPDAPVSSDGSAAAVAPAAFEGVRGRVLDPSGRPFEGAAVTAASTPGSTVSVPDIAAITGPDGRFEWALPPGRFRLTATRDGRSASVDVEVVAGRAVTADIRF